MNETRGNILIIDDTVDNLQLLTDLLTKQGYSVRPANSGRVGLLSAQQLPPDLILLDIDMPDMDGYEVCRRLKADAELSAIPVVFLSVHLETFDKLRAFEVGGVDYISKPFQAYEVLARIRTHLTLRQRELDLIRLMCQQQQYFDEMSALQDQFFGALAHDLKNPLGIVVGYADLLSSSAADALSGMYVQQIRAASAFMDELINDMLDLARIKSGMQVMFDPVSLKLLATMLYENLVGSAVGIELHLLMPDDDLIVLMDAKLMKRAVINVLSNAVKFTPQGGQVTLRLGWDALTYFFMVEDTGIGIPEDDLPHLMERFYRVRRSQSQDAPGTGLGMSIVKAVVDQHSGRIDIHSQVGVGTVVTLSFPRTAA